MKGSVLIIGGGIGGIQSALDLAESGFRAYILDSSPSIGGVMAMLDKTFPTNDCSMCILSPKLVEAAQHPNIEILSYCELEKIEGEAGEFQVKYTRKSRYVDEKLCTGCGACSEACAVRERVPDEFNAGLSKRSAIYIPFAQAVPRLAVVDPSFCLLFTKGKCKSPCLDACERKAINFDLKDRSENLTVGAIIIASGARPMPKERISAYHPEHPNVISSIEAERLMCASGPTGGKILRPSDGSPVERIAFIQCAGSRDENFNPYCSSVCCTYAIKEATVIKEHDPNIDCHIFHIDMRTFGKWFERFRERAKKDYGIRFTRFKVPSVEVNSPDTLTIRFIDDEGSWRSEDFDLVVLSVGLVPESVRLEINGRALEVNEHGFLSTSIADLVRTSVPGVHAIGTATSPKDIPETVAQASAASALASSLLQPARGSEVVKKEYPPEKQLDGSEPRIGVFVCSCGKNIGGIVDVDEVTRYSEGLPGVVYAEKNIYTCSSESCERIKEAIKTHDLNRVVVAACTPRTHEPLFRETIREAGLNRYLFEFANIRDQCSWVHSKQPEAATQKAKDLVRMSVSRAALLEPLPELPVKVTQSALVIGGGAAGIAASLEIARSGFPVYLLEREDKLGGSAAGMPGLEEFGEAGEAVKRLANMIGELESLQNVEIITGARLLEFSGYIGNFSAVVEANSKARELKNGVVIISTGSKEHIPTSYLYGKNPDVMLQSEFAKKIADGYVPDRVVMVQCVESRDDERPYCSRVCCISALTNTLALKKKRPEAKIFILYRDLMSYGLYEDLYRKAREEGVIFIRYSPEEKPVVTESKEGLSVQLKSPDLRFVIEIDADCLVLSAPAVPDPENGRIAELLKVPLDEHGFFLEGHVKLKPVDFATAGIFLAGTAHYPKLIEEAISQGYGAAGRALTILTKDYVMSEGAVAEVNPRYCRGCGECVEVCEFGAITLEETTGGILSAKVNSALCVGCGMCAVSCWSDAIKMANFTDEQIEAMIDAFSGESP